MQAACKATCKVTCDGKISLFEVRWRVLLRGGLICQQYADWPNKFIKIKQAALQHFSFHLWSRHSIYLPIIPIYFHPSSI